MASRLLFDRTATLLFKEGNVARFQIDSLPTTAKICSLTLESIPDPRLLSGRGSLKERVMQIGQVAKLTEVSVDTVRHYERCGLLNGVARTPAGYRMYSSDAVEQIRIIRSALAVGFTNAELSRIFRTRNAGGAPCREVRAIAGVKLENLEQDIQRMQMLRRELKRVIRCWDKMLTAARPGQQAHLLEILLSQKSKGDRK